MRSADVRINGTAIRVITVLTEGAAWLEPSQRRASRTAEARAGLGGRGGGLRLGVNPRPPIRVACGGDVRSHRTDHPGVPRCDDRVLSWGRVVGALAGDGCRVAPARGAGAGSRRP